MNSSNQLCVQLVHSCATCPKRATPGSVGYDLTCVQDTTLFPGTLTCIPTGVAVALPPGCYGRIAPRSSLTLKNGLNVGAGVIDPDYRGEIKVCMFNHSNQTTFLKVGDKIAQLILESCITPDVIQVNSLIPTDRGVGGFGSTGK